MIECCSFSGDAAAARILCTQNNHFNAQGIMNYVSFQLKCLNQF